MADEKKDGVGSLHIGNSRVGIIGLDFLLGEAKKRDFQDEEALAKFLLEGVKARNYVSSSFEDKYQRALLAEYKKFTGILDEEDILEGILEIKILGSNCPRCQMLEQETMAAITEMDVPADLEHISDPGKIGEYGVMGTPALIVNKKVKSAGKVLKKEEIKRLLSEELKKGYPC